MVAPSERQKIQDADAGRSRRARLPRPGRRRAATLLDLAAQGRPLEAALFPRRRPLGSEAAEQRALVQDRTRLARSVAEAERLDGVALKRIEPRGTRGVTGKGNNHSHPRVPSVPRG